MNLVECTAAHVPEIREIFNEAILNSTALYDDQPRSLDTVENWFSAKKKADYPVLGILSDKGILAGFASYGSFRALPAYKYTVEHSVYVHAGHRGCGVGARLLFALIEAARSEGYHMMIGGIDSANTASLRLHERLGFTHCGHIRHAGFKFGRWLDLDFYQLLLSGPENPSDG
jgi:L-amino acid N-acyltransferase YncA